MNDSKVFSSLVMAIRVVIMPNEPTTKVMSEIKELTLSDKVDLREYFKKEGYVIKASA